MRIAILLALVLPLGAQSVHFRDHVIATGLKGGYQVVVADLNHDGKPDLIALASGMPDLVWYENPSWKPHVIYSGLSHMINCAAYDIDGDGIPEIAIAWNFANDASKSIGDVGILHHDGDPANPWKLRKIDQLPTSHRLRWADIDGSGHKVLLDTPLTGPKAAPPDYEGHAPVVYYRPDDWKRRVVSEANEGVQHGVFITRWRSGDKRDSILTASFSGIDLFAFNGKAWSRTEIAKGDPAPCPKCGSSDIAIGHIGKRRFIAAIEPWHGNQVVIYSEHGHGWNRGVIDDSLVDGHTILTADFDGSGHDAIVAGFRGGQHGVFLYQFEASGRPPKRGNASSSARTPPIVRPKAQHDPWSKIVVDSGEMAAAACAAADLNGDGRTDLACIGAATANLKWYENDSRAH
jgi:hypothetical protein